MIWRVGLEGLAVESSTGGSCGGSVRWIDWEGDDGGASDSVDQD